MFREDKLIGFISVPDTRVLNLIRDKITGTSFAVPVDNKQGAATIRMNPIHTTMDVTLNNGHPHVKLSIAGEGHVSSIDTDLALNTAAGYRQLDQMESNYLLLVLLDVLVYRFSIPTNSSVGWFLRAALLTATVPVIARTTMPKKINTSSPVHLELKLI
ncbi:Ger(x)C family spore germination C-terminal domain-containing protein [Paenibacillus sp. P46E]|uniref:Ger(x)C family spore germination C-terminal domain-containing protein n=1 Tax=Paenibacillus sp. P46E TaxID=1349436 RepID=UPI000ADB8C23|nr:Ger(x)C family spore germination C-terminal domain-containing protein [Paenibacillus sp. P46E]